MLPDYIVPLYNHQVSAIGKLHNGNILVGGVGSGKTRTSLAYYIYRVLGIGTLADKQLTYNASDFKDTKRTLYVITTARKRDTLDWEKECIPFGLYNDDRCPIELVVDSWNNIKKYVDVKNSYFIFDEQRVVGYGTWTKSFLKITKNNGWVLLSATPGDTWTDYMPVFIANGFYKNKTDFISRHAVYSRFSKYPKIERYVETARLQRLRRDILVEMNFERATVANHITIVTDYDKDAYSKIFKGRWNVFENKPLRDAGEMCLCLRKLVNVDPSKIVRLTKLLSDHPKSIIFYNFNYELEVLRAVCADEGFEIGEWNGHNHTMIPESDKWVYLVQYNAGAEGWNCTETDTLIFFSQNYSYKIMTQAAGRIDRLNTPFKDLYYYHMRTNSPIDRSIEYALKRKKNFNESRFAKW